VRGALGDLKLLGFPNLEGFGERPCTSSEAQQNARAFLVSTDFEDMSGLKMVNVFSAIKSAWSDDDGLVRKNVRLCSKKPRQLFPDAAASQDDAQLPMRTPEAELDVVDDEELEEHLEDVELDEELIDELDEVQDDGEEVRPDRGASGRLILKEKRVKVGENVCAFGVYSGDKRGLVPGGLGADHFIKLVRGRPDAIEAAARARVWRNIVGGILGLTAVHAGAWAILSFAPK
jgi:hypothetical protein